MEPDTLELFADFIRETGFPIFVAGFLLWDRHKLISELKEEMAQFRQLLQQAVKGDE